VDRCQKPDVQETSKPHSIILKGTTMKKLCFIFIIFLLAACNTASITEKLETQATAQTVLNKWYTLWKNNYLEPACGSTTQARIHTDDAAYYTVSEGQGYGMLITVMLGDQTTFNKLYAYVKAHPSITGSGLMGWAQNANCANIVGADSATDGDLDIAYALLIASKKWGTQQVGTPVANYNYRTEAKRVIDAIKQWTIFPAGHPLEYMTNVGDWVGPGSNDNGSRTSDWMFDHFRAFSKFAKEFNPNDTFWDKVLAKHYSVLATLQAQNPTTGLISDFTILRNGSWRPAPSGWLESNDNRYYYNACRDPWRIGTDAVINNEARAKTAARKLNNWVRVTVGDPNNILDGYRLNGSSFGTFNSLCFSAPFIVPAYLAANDPSNPNRVADQAWYGDLLSYLDTVEPQEYYNNSVVVNSLIVVAGKYLNY
jgi:endoglucanase